MLSIHFLIPDDVSHQTGINPATLSHHMKELELDQILFMKPLLDGHKLKVRFHSLTFKHPVKARLLIGCRRAV